MSPATKPGRGFAARIMTLQFAVLGLLIVVVTIATIVVSYNRVFERAENASLAIARCRLCGRRMSLISTRSTFTPQGTVPSSRMFSAVYEFDKIKKS